MGVYQRILEQKLYAKPWFQGENKAPRCIHCSRGMLTNITFLSCFFSFHLVTRSKVRSTSEHSLLLIQALQLNSTTAKIVEHKCICRPLQLCCFSFRIYTNHPGLVLVKICIHTQDTTFKRRSWYSKLKGHL